MIKRIGKYNVETTRYSMTKLEFEEFKKSYTEIIIIAKTNDTITIEVTEYRHLIEKY